MEPLLTQFTDRDQGDEAHQKRLENICNRLKTGARRGIPYLKLMATGQLLNVIWPCLKASGPRFKSIEILEDRPGGEFREMDLRGADVVVNPFPIANNTVPFGHFYGVRVLWAQGSPREPVVRVRLARIKGSRVDTDTDALKIHEGINVTHYQLTGCVVPKEGREATDPSGTARWIACASTDIVRKVLLLNPDIVGHLEEAKTTVFSHTAFLKRIGLKGGAEVGGTALRSSPRTKLYGSTSKRASISSQPDPQLSTSVIRSAAQGGP